MRPTGTTTATAINRVIPRSRLGRVGVCCCGTVCAIMLSASVVGCNDGDKAADRLPTTEEWLRSVSTERERFMKRIRQSPDIVGRTEKEIRDWLGDPDVCGQTLWYKVDPALKRGPAFSVELSEAGRVEYVQGSAFPRMRDRMPNSEVEVIAAQWRTGDYAARLAAADALCGKRLEGLSREAVIELLGPPVEDTGLWLRYYGRSRDRKRQWVADGRAGVLSFLIRDGRVERCAFSRDT